MKTLFKRAALAIGAVALLVVAACGGDRSATTTTNMAEEGMEGEFPFGEPADPADADRTVEITASDDFTFNPAAVIVTQGETVTFRVINDGQLPHDFILGDGAAQDEHEDEMSEMDGMIMPDEPNAITVAAGETK